MILTVDPGVTTGFATDEYKAYQIRLLDYPSPHLVLFDHLSEVKPSLLIYESFHWRQGQLNAVFTGVEFIGVLELWAQLHRSEIHKINPSDGKGFWDDRKIRALGLYKPGCPHGIDAMRLLLTWRMKMDAFWKVQVLKQLKV